MIVDSIRGDVVATSLVVAGNGTVSGTLDVTGATSINHALASGMLSVTTATGAVASTAFTSTRIPFGSGVGGKLSDSPNFTYSVGGNVLSVGAPFIAGTDFCFQQNVDSHAYMFLGNNSAGASAHAAIRINASPTDTLNQNELGLYVIGAGATFGTILTANAGAMIHTPTSTAANLAIANRGAVGSDIVFATTASDTERMRITNGGIIKIGGAASGIIDLTFNAGALATTAVAGFLYLPGGAGPPTGVPTNAGPGKYPIYWDATNSKLYIYNGGWKGGTNPGGWT